MTSVLSARLHGAAQWYHDLTVWLQETSGASEPMLHVHAGLAIWLVTSFTTRRWPGQFLPFWVVVAAALVNEGLDLIKSGIIADDTVIDILNTIGWPFLITLCLRLGHRSVDQQSVPTASPSGDLPA